MNLIGVLEGILFVVGDEGISISDLKNILEVDESKIKSLLDILKKRYESVESGFVLECFGEKFKLMTKKEHKHYYQKLVLKEQDEKLTPGALEVLAIIAYKGPITRIEVEEIRGVNSSHFIHRLLYKDLIEEKGRSELPGKPILYGVTDTFLDYLGLHSLEDLPQVLPVQEKKEEIGLFESRYQEIDS